MCESIFCVPSLLTCSDAFTQRLIYKKHLLLQSLSIQWILIWEISCSQNCCSFYYSFYKNAEPQEPHNYICCFCYVSAVFLTKLFQMFSVQLKSFICFNVTTISVLFLICFSKRVATQKFWKLRRQRNRWKWNRAFARAKWSTLTPNKKDREHLKRSSLFRGLISAVDNGEDDISLTSQDLMMDTNEDHFWKQGQ